MKTLRRAAAAVLALLCSGSLIAGVWLDLAGEADNAIAEERWEDAETALLKALAAEPANPLNALLVSNLGMVRFARGEDSLARVSLDEAVDMAPVSTVILSNRGRVRMATGNLEGAYADYSRAASLDSTLLEQPFYCAVIRLRQGDLDGARQWTRRLVDVAPDSTQTALALALLASSEDNPAEAVRQYGIVVRKDPQPEYYQQIAWLNLSLDRLAEASDAIATGIRLDPLDSEFYLARAALALKRYRRDDAAADVHRALELGASPERAAFILQGY